MDEIGLDEAGRAATGHTLYTLECHLNYLAEVKLGAEVEVRTQLLGFDAKRLHIHHSLHYPGEAAELAASEQMLMNIDSLQGRSAPFAEPVLGCIRRMAEDQAELPPPAHVGRVIALPRR
ncbi:L-carnitine dehydrogenase [compost metagenome]